MKAKAITKNAFLLRGRGLIISLQHTCEGLPNGTILLDEKTGLQWTLHYRILYAHADGCHQLFSNEMTEEMLLRFESKAQQEASLNQLVETEKQHIYVYLIQAVGHDARPNDEAELTIVLKEV